MSKNDIPLCPIYKQPMTLSKERKPAYVKLLNMVYFKRVFVCKNKHSKLILEKR
jgi:hypothetical protein